MAGKMLWDHFDAIEMARFLGSSAEAVKRMSPRDLAQAVIRQIAFNARQARALSSTQNAEARKRPATD